jgi:hypothetical protein
MRPQHRRSVEPAGLQQCEGVVDHQMVDAVPRDAGLGKGRGAGDT